MTRQQEYEARLLLQTRQIRICRIMILILFLSLWELTASLGLINRFIFSSPSQILFCLWNMLLDKLSFMYPYQPFNCPFSLVQSFCSPDF